MKKQRIVIGMSGGVDSSTAAALLKEQGYEVVGLTMRLWDGEEIDGEFRDGTCCSLSAVEDARRVAYKLGIEYHVLDFRDDFKQHVIDYFVDSYTNAKTPNPCIACNKHLKFDAMLKKAKILDCDLVATGHYAKIEQNENGRYILRRAECDVKDQTYALYSLSQEQLKHIRMPLGNLSGKDETRRIAKELCLPTASKPDSQEICFVPDNDYASFIERHLGVKSMPGNYIDSEGNVLGQHKGIINYTIGQRKGLGIAFGKPMFVTKIDPVTNDITLGEKGCEFSKSLTADNLNFIPFDTLTEPMRVLAKVRYSAKPAWCTIAMSGENEVRVEFDEPQRAVTPGQAVVFYDENYDIVIGGGIIRNGGD